MTEENGAPLESAETSEALDVSADTLEPMEAQGQAASSTDDRTRPETTPATKRTTTPALKKGTGSALMMATQRLQPLRKQAFGAIMRTMRAARGTLARFSQVRFNALTLIAALLVLALAGVALAVFTLPGEPSPLVIVAPTATDASYTAQTASPNGYPTSAPGTPQGSGLGSPAPNAPIIPTPQPGTEPNICPTPATLPTPTTAPGRPTPTTVTTHTTGNCIPCNVYLGSNPTQSEIASALATAANLYRLPGRLVEAVAWQESNWHEDIVSCDGGIGLMQIQETTYGWLNQQLAPACQLGRTSYDPFTLEGNADLGAKYLKYLSCFYSYWGADDNATASAPATYTAEWYYRQAGRAYPDTSAAQSLCVAGFRAVRQVYTDLPSTTANTWSCPFSAHAGDYSLLELTLSAYNEGAAYTDTYGVQNLGYVQRVEAFVVYFAGGLLPD